MLSRIQCGHTPGNEPALSQLDQLEKVVIFELKASQLQATKTYTYSLIRSIISEPAHPTKDECSRVLIFDGRFFFRESEFTCNFLKEPAFLTHIRIHRAVDDSMMMLLLNEYFKVNMACNHDLRLVLIAVNSSTLFPDLLKKINSLIFSISVSAHVILIVDELTQPQVNLYCNKSYCAILSCKQEADEKETVDDTDLNFDHLVKKSTHVKLSIFKEKHLQMTKLVEILPFSLSTERPTTKEV